tara:strand:+ start:1054 stop:1284 length:231 start_codon:yes stop_codon:yes gene_type:complete
MELVDTFSKSSCYILQTLDQGTGTIFHGAAIVKNAMVKEHVVQQRQHYEDINAELAKPSGNLTEAQIANLNAIPDM